MSPEVHEGPRENPDKRVDQLRKEADAMVKLAKALKKLPDDAARIRVLRCLAIIHGIELP
jgi:hypothetical protein